MIEDKLNLNDKYNKFLKKEYNNILKDCKYKLDNLVDTIKKDDNIYGGNRTVVIVGDYANYFKSKLKDDYYMLNFIVTDNIEKLNANEKYSSVKLFTENYNII